MPASDSAMALNEKAFIADRNWLLAGIGGGIFILAAWMTIETVVLFFTASKSAQQQQRRVAVSI